jgi:hypothetical protein
MIVIAARLTVSIRFEMERYLVVRKTEFKDDREEVQQIFRFLLIYICNRPEVWNVPTARASVLAFSPRLIETPVHSP